MNFNIQSLFFTLLCTLFFVVTGFAQLPQNEPTNKNLKNRIDKMANQLESQVIDWRRHLHQYPELSNREFKTAEYVAKHLKKLGIKVQTGIAHTGVVGVLKGGKPGPVVALRADMDALPVVERVDLPFASKVKSTYNDMEVSGFAWCSIRLYWDCSRTENIKVLIEPDMY